MHIITRMNVGGAAGFVLDACRRLPREEFAQAVIAGPAPAYEGSMLEDLAALGVEAFTLDSLRRAPHPLRDEQAGRALTGHIRRWAPDVVHTHTAKAGYLGRAAAYSAGIPAVHHVHGWAALHEGGGLRRGLYLYAERRAARWCDRLLVVTPRDRELGLGLGIGRPGQYALVRAGIDADEVRSASDGPAPEAIARLAAEGPVVGFLGRLCDQKDPLAFLAAARLVARARPEARFLLLGDGPQRARVAREAARSGLGERLVLQPFCHEVPAVLRRLAALAHPSRHEGLPRLLLEALAVGTPIAATAVDGCAELLADGRNALVVAPRDPFALAAAVSRLLEDRALAGRLTETGRRELTPYGIDDALRVLAEVYRSTARRR